MKSQKYDVFGNVTIFLHIKVKKYGEELICIICDSKSGYSRKYRIFYYNLNL